MSAFRVILAPTDFSDASSTALDYAVGLARATGATLHLFHAYESPLLELAPYDFAFPRNLWDDVRKAAGEQLEAWRARVADSGVVVEAHLTHGVPSDAIARVAGEIGADLIVMATHGRTGLAHVLLGSVSERTLRTAPCPVLSVKQRD